MKKLAGWFLIVLLIAGCAGDGHPPTYKTTGKVTFQNQPCNGALVVFHPLAAGRENDPKPVGTTRDDGTYSLTTFAEDDGAPEGEYAVTIVWNVKNPKVKFSLGEGGGMMDKLGGRYGNPKQPLLKATITAQENNTHDFDLK